MAKHVITPVWQTQRGSVVRASGCAVGVPVAGAKVFGETRQNLWSNPSTATRNGVTLTSNDDGSVKLSGTATATAYFYIGSYILKPGTQYCFSGSGFQEGANAYIQNADEANFVGVGNQSKTFTTKSAFGDAAVFGIQVAEGTTVNDTVRVMLNEGGTAQPWCPPGLTSVSELSIKAGASEGDPDASEAAIDLSGHQLRSLPDGTRDVLTVDGSGAVVVERACAESVLDGSSDENWVMSGVSENQYRFALNGSVPGVINDTLGTDEYLCDRLPKYINDWTENNVLINGIYQVFITREGVTTVEELRAWLASDPVTLVYPLATPQTVPLDPITPPSIPAADATLWAASDVPCDLEATTWTASGAEQGRQQAAMVALAQQVRQQAETVAALAAKALEA